MDLHAPNNLLFEDGRVGLRTPPWSKPERSSHEAAGPSQAYQCAVNTGLGCLHWVVLIVDRRDRAREIDFHRHRDSFRRPRDRQWVVQNRGGARRAGAIGSAISSGPSRLRPAEGIS